MTSKSVPIPDAGSLVGGGSPTTVRDTPPNILSEESYTVFGSSVCRALLEQNYDVRKKGAREVEDIVKFYQSKGSEVSRQKVTAILVLLARDFLLNPVKDARVGGLIGIAGAAIGLQGASKFYLHLLVPPVVDCFRNGESDMSIKYFAAESLYNILRVAPADCSVYLEEMVSVLIRLWNDTDVSIVKAAECMDTCLRDIAERFATDTQLADVVALLMSELPLILEESSIVLAVPKLYTLHWLKLILQKLTRTVKVSPLIPRITTFAAMPLSNEQRKVVLQLLTMGTESLIGKSSCDATSDILAMFHDLKVQVEHPGTSDKVRLLDFLFLGMMCGAKSTGGVMTIESIQAAFDEEALGLDSTKLTDVQPNMNRLMSPNAVFVSEHLPQMVELLQGLMGSWSREELEIFGVLDECMRRLCLKLPFKASETWYRELSAALSSQLKRSHRSNTMVMRSVVNWVTFVVTNDTQWSLSNDLLNELICLVCSNQTTDLKNASVEAFNALVQSRVHYSRLIRAILSRIKSNVKPNDSNQIQFLSLVQLLDDTIYKNQSTATPDHASWIATIEAEDDASADAKTSTPALSYAQEHMLALAVTLVLVFGKSAQLLDLTIVLKNITKCSHFWSRHPGCILMLIAAAGMPGQALEHLPRWTATVVASHLRDLCMVQLEFLPIVLENPHFVSTRLHWKPLYDFLVYVLPVGCVGHKIAVARSSGPCWALTNEGVLPSYFAQVSSKTPDWPLNPLSELTITLPSELRKDFSKPDLEVLKHECSAVISIYWHIILPHFAYNGVLSSQMADLGGRQTAMGVKCHAAMGSQAFGYVGDRRSAMDIVFDGVSCQGKEPHPHVLMPDETVVVTSGSPPLKMNSVTIDANMSPSQEVSRTQFSNDRNVDIGSVPVSPTTERGLSLQDPEVGGSGVFSSSSVAQEPEQLKRQPKYTRAAEANSVAKDLSVESPSNTNSTDVSPSASQYEVLTSKDRSR